MRRGGPRTGRLLPALLLAGLALAVAAAGPWMDLDEDSIHDPGGPGIDILQEPGEALARLPQDSAGNHVDWIRAFQGGYIAPRGTLDGEGRVEILDLDVIMPETSTLPMVRFPHKPHTQWLDCTNCHEHLFRSKAGATPVNMLSILQGQYCGVCHGAVAFPLTECNRCHSVSDADAATVAAARRRGRD